MCVCSLSYPACKAQGPYLHLWSVRLYNIFPHYLINDTIKKTLKHKMCILIFPTIFVCNISYSKNNWARKITNAYWSSCKCRFTGLLQHCGRSAYCVLTLNKFPHSSPEAPRIIQMRETSTSEGGNYYQ